MYTITVTWLEVGHYWQVTIDEEKMYLKECFTYLDCVLVTHLLIAGFYITLFSSLVTIQNL